MADAKAVAATDRVASARFDAGRRDEVREAHRSRVRRDPANVKEGGKDADPMVAARQLPKLEEIKHLGHPAGARETAPDKRVVGEVRSDQPCEVDKAALETATARVEASKQGDSSSGSVEKRVGSATKGRKSSSSRAGGSGRRPKAKVRRSIRGEDGPPNGKNAVMEHGSQDGNLVGSVPRAAPSVGNQYSGVLDAKVTVGSAGEANLHADVHQQLQETSSGLSAQIVRSPVDTAKCCKPVALSVRQSETSELNPDEDDYTVGRTGHVSTEAETAEPDAMGGNNRNPEADYEREESGHSRVGRTADVTAESSTLADHEPHGRSYGNEIATPLDSQVPRTVAPTIGLDVDENDELLEIDRDYLQGRRYLPTPVVEALCLPISEGQKRRLTVGQDEYNIIGGPLGELDPRACANGERRPLPSTGISNAPSQRDRTALIPSPQGDFADNGDDWPANLHVHHIIVRPRASSDLPSPWPSDDEDDPKCGSSPRVVVGLGGPNAKPRPQRPQLQTLRGVALAASSHVVVDAVRADCSPTRKQAAANMRNLRSVKTSRVGVVASDDALPDIPGTPRRVRKTAKSRTATQDNGVTSVRKRRRSVAPSSPASPDELDSRPAKQRRVTLSSPIRPIVSKHRDSRTLAKQRGSRTSRAIIGIDENVAPAE